VRACPPALTVIALLASLLASAPAASAQPLPTKTARIGLLGDVAALFDEAFREEVRELGWVEGQNLTIERRVLGGKYEQLPTLAADLVRLKMDVIVTSTPPATEAAKRATSTIPIVFTVSADPVADGFVASLARPGGNVTELATMSAELVGKQLGLLRAVAPKVTRVAVLLNPQLRGHRVSVQQAEGAAKTLGVQILTFEADKPAAIDAAFVSMKGQGAGGLIVLRDNFFRTQRVRIVGLVPKHRLPAVYGLREEAEAGGLMSYGASVLQMYQRAAVYVDKILRGAKPADLPVEQPTKSELVINLKTAKALGLTMPSALLAQADQVIE